LVKLMLYQFNSVGTELSQRSYAYSIEFIKKKHRIFEFYVDFQLV